MTIDYGSGLSTEQDLALTGPLEADPQAAETMNFWAYDPDQNIGLNIHPRIHNGQMHVMVTLFLADGTILRQRADTGGFDNGASPGSAHVRYQCVQPFQCWTYVVEKLPAFTTSDAGQRAGIVDDETPDATISFALQSEAAAPIWLNGTMTAEAVQMMKGPAGLWIAGRLGSGIHPDSYRYDQLVKVTGSVETPDGPKDFTGFGLRCHVRGVRNLTGMAGTCWMSGLFPSGKGFGVMVNIGADGRYSFSEAYTTDGKTITPARILQFPRRHRDLDEGPFWIQLASDVLGLVDISGEDVRAFYWSMQDWGASAASPPVYGKDPHAGVLMKQALARYIWNDEIGYGLNERSG